MKTIKNFKKLMYQETAKKVAVDIANFLTPFYKKAVEDGVINSYNLEVFPIGKGYEVKAVVNDEGRERTSKFFHTVLIIFITPEAGLNDFSEWVDSDIITVSIHSHRICDQVEEKVDENFNIDISATFEKLMWLMNQ